MASPATLVSLEAAKQQLRVTHSEEDMLIEDLLSQAEDVVLDYHDDLVDDTWTEATIPGWLKADILRTLTYLWSRRGEDITELDHEKLRAQARFLFSYPRRGPNIA